MKTVESFVPEGEVQGIPPYVLESVLQVLAEGSFPGFV
jgi:hypothetical protein